MLGRGEEDTRLLAFKLCLKEKFSNPGLRKVQEPRCRRPGSMQPKCREMKGEEDGKVGQL